MRRTWKGAKVLSGTDRVESIMVRERSSGLDWNWCDLGPRLTDFDHGGVPDSTQPPLPPLQDKNTFLKKISIDK